MSVDQFIWHPNQASKSEKPKVYNAPFGDGYEQNFPKGINFNPATWTLSFTGASAATIESIDQFLTSQGGYLKFTWTPPDSSAQLLWICREWQPKYSSGGVGSLTAVFNQQFGA